MIVEDENGHEIDLHDLADDREPELPEEHEQPPLDLDEISRRVDRLRFLAPASGLKVNSAQLSDAEDLEALRELIGCDVPGLIAEAESFRRQATRWEGLETDTVYASAHGGKQLPDDCALWVHHRDGESADRSVEAAAGAATAYMRTRTLHPWVEYGPAPF